MRRQVEDVRVEKLQKLSPHLFIASAGESSNYMETVFTVQFFFGDSLDYVEKLLRDEAFEFPEGLLRKNRANLFFSLGYTLIE